MHGLPLLAARVCDGCRRLCALQIQRVATLWNIFLCVCFPMAGLDCCHLREYSGVLSYLVMLTPLTLTPLTLTLSCHLREYAGVLSYLIMSVNSGLSLRCLYETRTLFLTELPCHDVLVRRPCVRHDRRRHRGKGYGCTASSATS